jgi:hypothetical protein
MTKAAAMRGGPVERIVVLANAAAAAASISDGGNIFIFASIWMRFFRNKVHRNKQECSGGLQPGVYWQKSSLAAPNGERQRKVVLTAKLRLLTNDFTDSATGDGIEATEYHGAKLFRKPFSQRQPLRVQKSEHKVNENEEFRLVMMLNFNMVHYVRGRRAVI